MQTIEQNIQFLILTFLVMGLIFVLLFLLGRKKNKEFAQNPEAALADHKLGLRDIVLLADGRRVAITEVVDGGASFYAETLPDYGKRAETLTFRQEEIVKIEYYAQS